MSGYKDELPCAGLGKRARKLITICWLRGLAGEKDLAMDTVVRQNRSGSASLVNVSRKSGIAGSLGQCQKQT